LPENSAIRTAAHLAGTASLAALHDLPLPCAEPRRAKNNHLCLLRRAAVLSGAAASAGRRAIR